MIANLKHYLEGDILTVSSFDVGGCVCFINITQMSCADTGKLIHAEPAYDCAHLTNHK